MAKKKQKSGTSSRSGSSGNNSNNAHAGSSNSSSSSATGGGGKRNKSKSSSDSFFAISNGGKKLPLPQKNLFWAALVLLLPFVALLSVGVINNNKQQKQRRQAVSDDDAKKEVVVNSSSSSKNDGQEKDKVDQHQQQQPYHYELPVQHEIVTWEDGGWPQNLVNGPYKKEESIFCYTKGCPAGDSDSEDNFIGFDWHSDDESIKRCEVLDNNNNYDSNNNNQVVNIRCEDDYYMDPEKQGEMAVTSYFDMTIDYMKCCERLWENDVTVYKNPINGLHYASAWDPDFMHWTIDTLSKDYPTVKYTNTIFLHYFNKIDDDVWGYEHYSIPYRVARSNYYQNVYHNLVRMTTTQIDNKILMAAAITKEQRKLAKTADTNTILPFPTTYTNCADAVNAKHTYDDTLLFIKSAISTRGMGIKVITKAQLKYHYDNPVEFGDVCKPGQSVIQEAVTDLQTINGKRFDIRFYFMMFNGKIYVHDYAVLFYIDDPADPTHGKYDPYDGKDMISHARRDSKTGRTVRVYSHEQPELWKDWIDSIKDGMKHAVPILEKLLYETRTKDKTYHIWGADAMIRNDGRVVFPEFNDWPNIHYDFKGDNGDDSAKKYKSRLVEKTKSSWSMDKEKYEFGPIQHGNLKGFYYDFIGRIYADFYSIVLGLATTTTETETETEKQHNDDNNGGNKSSPSSSLLYCDGRVTRILPHGSHDASSTTSGGQQQGEL